MCYLVPHGAHSTGPNVSASTQSKSYTYIVVPSIKLAVHARPADESQDLTPALRAIRALQALDPTTVKLVEPSPTLATHLGILGKVTVGRSVNALSLAPPKQVIYTLEAPTQLIAFQLASDPTARRVLRVALEGKGIVDASVEPLLRPDSPVLLGMLVRGVYMPRTGSKKVPDKIPLTLPATDGLAPALMGPFRLRHVTRYATHVSTARDAPLVHEVLEQAQKAAKTVSRPRASADPTPPPAASSWASVVKGRAPFSEPELASLAASEEAEQRALDGLRASLRRQAEEQERREQEAREEKERQRQERERQRAEAQRLRDEAHRQREEARRQKEQELQAAIEAFAHLLLHLRPALTPDEYDHVDSFLHGPTLPAFTERFTFMNLDATVACLTARFTKLTALDHERTQLLTKLKRGIVDCASSLIARALRARTEGLKIVDSLGVGDATAEEARWCPAHPTPNQDDPVACFKDVLQALCTRSPVTAPPPGRAYGHELTDLGFDFHALNVAANAAEAELTRLQDLAESIRVKRATRTRLLDGETRLEVELAAGAAMDVDPPTLVDPEYGTETNDLAPHESTSRLRRPCGGGQAEREEDSTAEDDVHGALGGQGHGSDQLASVQATGDEPGLDDGLTPEEIFQLNGPAPEPPGPALPPSAQSASSAARAQVAAATATASKRGGPASSSQ